MPSVSDAKVAVIFPTKRPHPCFELSPLAKSPAEKRRQASQSSHGRGYLQADFTTVPLFAILLSLVTKYIDGHDSRQETIGDGEVKPLSIMALLISLVPNAS